MPPSVQAVDVASFRQAELLAALLDHRDPPWRPGELPPLGHWLLFPPATAQSGLGADGHPARGDTALPRRMWAGSRVRFLAPVLLGGEVSRETTEVSATEKTGRSGRMLFVTLRHRISAGGTVLIDEEQDIVYREAAVGSTAPPPPEGPGPALPPVVRHVRADTIQLFRYSALTFNSHRIHYDRPYATGVEGYPALVVHGPYIATLLMDLFLRQHPGALVTGFSFRAMRPVFDTDPFTLGLTEDAGGGDLLAIDSHGQAAMKARIDWDSVSAASQN